jgi:ubiquinone/menaquinone biosynthesis C-methylase UbiE
MTVRKWLYHAYSRCERVIAPGLRYSQSVYEDALDQNIAPGSHWLDVGCGHQVLPAWRETSEKALVGRAGLVVGFDADLPSLYKHRTISLRTFGNGNQLPFADETFDLVTANMVVEHLDHPEKTFGEMFRVIRPGGRFLFHTPNVKSYATRAAQLFPDNVKLPVIRLLEGRRADDVFPTFYRANTAGDIEQVAKQAGFEVQSISMITTTALFAFVLPVAIAELILLRSLMKPGNENRRPNIIALLRKPLQ